MEIYEKLWNEAVAVFERGGPRIEPHLLDKAKDARRGVTLVLRPTAPVRDALAEYIERLKAICPGQYFYRPEEMHVTVLSIITMTELWQEEMPRLEAARPILREVLEQQHPFKIQFRGVTAAPDSVMIQGFPVGDGLAVIREAVREAFARAGFGDMLDRRYKVSAAHISIMRFSKPCSEIKRLVEFLKESCEKDFGECEITNLELILGDWYASAVTVKTLEEYWLLP